MNRKNCLKEKLSSSFLCKFYFVFYLPISNDRIVKFLKMSTKKTHKLTCEFNVGAGKRT